MSHGGRTLGRVDAGLLLWPDGRGGYRPLPVADGLVAGAPAWMGLNGAVARQVWLARIAQRIDARWIAGSTPLLMEPGRLDRMATTRDRTWHHPGPGPAMGHHIHTGTVTGARETRWWVRGTSLNHQATIWPTEALARAEVDTRMRGDQRWTKHGHTMTGHGITPPLGQAR